MNSHHPHVPRGKQSLRARRSRWIASGVALGGALGSFSVLAQQAAAPVAATTAKPDGDTLDSTTTSLGPVTSVQTIVVTARKRSEKLTEVPLSITAVDAGTIKDAGLHNLQDIAHLTTGLTISAAGAEAQLAPTIRGLTNLNGGSGDPNVAVFLDGIYLANNSAISLGLVAVERVEVVKGPVSALYGRNAFAGAINYISKKPTRTLEGEIEAGVSSYGGRTLKTTISGSIVPGLARLLVSAGTDKSDGSWKDSVTGARAGGYDKRDELASLTLTPTKQLTIEGSVYFGNDKFGDVALGNATNNCGSKTSTTQVVNADAFKQFCGKFEYGPVQVPSIKPGAGVTGNQRQVESDRLRLNYDFDSFSASLLYGHNNVKQRRYNDFTGSDIGIPYALANIGSGSTPNGTILLANEQFGNILNNRDTQAEFRVGSRLNTPVRWSAGYNSYSASSAALTLIGIDGSGLPAGMQFANVVGLPVQTYWVTSNGQFGPGIGNTTQTDRVSSPFASVDWDILPALTASAEIRHTQEDKSQTIFSTTTNPAPVNVAGNGTNTGSKSFSFNNFRTALRYKFADDQMAYVSWADGTKAGGFNGRATVAADLTFNPETNRTIEAGTKLAFFEHKVEAGLAVFHIETSGIQISGPASDPTNPGLVTKNFGGTTSNGFELDLAAVPITGLRLNAGLGFADSKFNSNSFDYTVSAADCNNIPGCAARLVTIDTPSGPKTAVSLGGLRVPRSSRYTGTLGAQYNGPINDQWGYLVRADYRIESSRMIQNANFAYIPTHDVVNLRAAVENDKYRFTVFVDNLTNNTTPEGVAQNVRLNDFTGPYAGALPAKRTYGVIGNMTF